MSVGLRTWAQQRRELAEAVANALLIPRKILGDAFHQLSAAASDRGLSFRKEPVSGRQECLRGLRGIQVIARQQSQRLGRVRDFSDAFGSLDSRIQLQLAQDLT